MRFDILSFGIGFLSATVFAFILYRLRARILALRAAAEERVGSTRQFIAAPGSLPQRHHQDPECITLQAT
jgi:hypothetical protein